MDYIWGTSIVETCLRMIIDLWELRNKEVHGKEEATKQKKRKDKAAISVRALHDLEEIARPSDSFLYTVMNWSCFHCVVIVFILHFILVIAGHWSIRSLVSNCL